MKKIFMLFVTAFAVLACDPTHEDISNAGHITVDELKAKTTVTVDKAASGQNGNVLTCSTSAPVNAAWYVDGDEGKIVSNNYYWKKLKLGDHVVTLKALCADGTVLTTDFSVNCQEITNPLQKFYIYGENSEAQPPFILDAGNAAAGRFSDNEGKFHDINGNEGFLPYLSDDIYWGGKTLVFDIIDAQEGKFIWGDDFGCTVRVMNGWWSSTYADNVPLKVGLWELPITEDIAKDCAQGNGGGGKDLDLLMTRGQVTIKSVYYEE